MTIHTTKIEEGDPVENMLKKTGCIELHYKVQARKNYINYDWLK